MDTSAEFLITLGSILLLGLFTGAAAQRTFLPRVTLLLLFGMLIGSQGLDWIPTIFSDRFQLIADMTLLMVGFLLGGKLALRSLKQSAKQVLWISISAALLTTFFVSLGLYALGLKTEVAILLGCIASATAPAALLDVVSESSSSSPFARLLLLVVAIDDVWALILFALGMALSSSLGQAEGSTPFLWLAFKDIGGAVVLGISLGLPAAYLTGRIKPGQPMILEAFGIVFLCGGLAIWLEVSYLIAAMVLGAVIVNRARHHEYPFHAIEGIEWPFMVIFFVLAGASLELNTLQDMGWLGLMYIFCRSMGKYAGAYFGCSMAKTQLNTRHWMGLALLPQAGVPVGMALVAAHQLPEHRHILLSLVISSTVIFEVFGPIFARWALQRNKVLV